MIETLFSRKPPTSRSAILLGLVFLTGLNATSCRQPAPGPAPSFKIGKEWVSLFDGQTLDGWSESNFGGEDEVAVKDGAITIDFGAAELAGVTWTGPALPTMNYEVTLEAMRVDGNDFFCGLTFGYMESHCSLILGGWGGSLVGISSFDYMDAADNETTAYLNFENNKWYRVLVRVTEDRIEAYIDGEVIVDTRPGDRKVDVRAEVEASKPFGVAAWNTRAALRDIRVRRIPPPDI